MRSTFRFNIPDMRGKKELAYSCGCCSALNRRDDLRLREWTESQVMDSYPEEERLWSEHLADEAWWERLEREEIGA